MHGCFIGSCSARRRSGDRLEIWFNFPPTCFSKNSPFAEFPRIFPTPQCTSHVSHWPRYPCLGSSGRFPGTAPPHQQFRYVEFPDSKVVTSRTSRSRLLRQNFHDFSQSCHKYTEDSLSVAYNPSPFPNQRSPMQTTPSSSQTSSGPAKHLVFVVGVLCGSITTRLALHPQQL